MRNGHRGSRIKSTVKIYSLLLPASIYSWQWQGENDITKCLEANRWRFFGGKLTFWSKIKCLEKWTWLKGNTNNNKPKTHHLLAPCIFLQMIEGGNDITSFLKQSYDGSLVGSWHFNWKIKCVEKWTRGRGIKTKINQNSPFAFCMYLFADNRGREWHCKVSGGGSGNYIYLLADNFPKMCTPWVVR